MIFKSYPKGETIGSGAYVFRHYGETGEMSRFAQFVEGSLEELTEADFEGIDTLSVACLSTNLSGSAAGKANFIGTVTGISSLKSIIIPSTVKTLKRPSTITGTIYWISNCDNLSYIKFPKNFPVQSKTGDVVCYSNASGDIVDFSEYTAVPTLNMTYDSETGSYLNSAMSFSLTTVKVPSSLLSSWQSAWANSAKNAKYEGV